MGKLKLRLLNPKVNLAYLYLVQLIQFDIQII